MRFKMKLYCCVTSTNNCTKGLGILIEYADKRLKQIKS